jgi:hypothetical protein
MSKDGTKFSVVLEVRDELSGDLTSEECGEIADFLGKAAKTADPKMAINLKYIAFHFLTGRDYWK